MARQSTDFEVELEDEFEGEFENEFEDEDEYEGEDEQEDEYEDEAFLGSLGGIARTVGGLLGGDGESEWEEESEWEDEGEFEDEAEEFFKRIGRAFKKAAPFLKVLAKTAGPMIATAVGGPAAGAVARLLTQQLEGEGEDEVEAEFEEMSTSPVSGSQAMAEYFAAQAASAESESEAEAFAGVAAFSSLSPRDRQELARMLPALLRGAAALTRLLYGNRRTRQGVRFVPGIVDAAGRTILRRAASGQPVGPADVGQVLGTSARRVLLGGSARQAVMRRHARGLTYARRHRVNYGSGYRRGYAPGYATGYGYGPGRRRGYGGRTRYLPGTGYPPGTGYSRNGHAGASVIRRQPQRTRVIGSGRVVPPRPGFVRVVTPVRVPPRGGSPARTVRVVSDVRVPRGAVAAGRPVSVSGPRRRPR